MKKVIITVKGIQVSADAPAENTELTTEGEYRFADGCGSFTYEETALTGMEGTTTRFDVTPGEVVISRSGTVSSRMVFVEGKKNVFLYHTPWGAMTMGINTHKIKNTLKAHGGVLDIRYSLTFDHAMTTKNRFIVKIKEQAGEQINGKFD